MDEDLKVDPKILRAYNTGYLLAKHAPQLTKTLTEALDHNNDWTQAFLAGKEEYQKEGSRELREGRNYQDYYNKLVLDQQAKDFFKNMKVPDKGMDKTKDIDRDK